MRIYIGHSGGFDYKKELYEPLKASDLFKEHEILLPHDSEDRQQNSRDFYADLDLFVGEVSYPSTGLGIELAWAHDAGRKIICVHRANKQPSWSIQTVCANIVSYNNSDELIEIIKSVIQN